MKCLVEKKKSNQLVGLLSISIIGIHEEELAQPLHVIGEYLKETKSSVATASKHQLSGTGVGPIQTRASTNVTPI
jgi:hypothetical protein